MTNEIISRTHTHNYDTKWDVRHQGRCAIFSLDINLHHSKVSQSKKKRKKILFAVEDRQHRDMCQIKNQAINHSSHICYSHTNSGDRLASNCNTCCIQNRETLFFLLQCISSSKIKIAVLTEHHQQKKKEIII